VVAHKIRNRYSKIFQDVCAVHAHYHWCLTGTPIQNCLDDFGALLTFINVNPFQSKIYFEKYISTPIKDRKKGSWELLRKVVAATCLRRTKDDHGLRLNLPQKLERVEEIEMPREDRKLYEFFKRFSFLTAGDGKTLKKIGATNILILISMLRLICDHGEALLPESALQAWRDRDPNLLTFKMLESGIKMCISCGCEIEELDVAESVIEELTCGHVLCESCVTKSQASDSQPSCLKCGTEGLKTPSVLSDSSPGPSQSELALPQKPPPSAKLQALLRNITEGRTKPTGETKPDKQYDFKLLTTHKSPCILILISVVFSYWTKMLDLIGASLRDRGMKFCRIDGQSSLPQRKYALERFGNDPAYNIMLASIGAAGEGSVSASTAVLLDQFMLTPRTRIDLTAANLVHITEPHWNPMAEAQAMDRIHRIGQQRDVEVIRYIVSDSIEKVRAASISRRLSDKRTLC